MKMKIMVGFDGSNVAKEALSLARKHAKAFNAQVYIVTSLEKISDDPVQDGLSGHSEIEVDAERGSPGYKIAEQGLDNAKILFEEDNIPCITHLLVRGRSPGEDLVEFSRENDIGEIIIGARKRSKVGKFLFGSTAQFVILNAECPVITVK